MEESVASIHILETKVKKSQDKIEFLENLKWWNWNVKEIKKHKVFFNLNINKFSVEDLEKILFN